MAENPPRPIASARLGAKRVVPDAVARAGGWAYVVSRFPLLSETFILREICELERQGQALRVYPLRAVGRGPRHQRLERMRAPVWVAPWWSWGCHWRRLRRQPGRYLRTLAEVLGQNRSDLNLLAGAVAYWGKAVAIAEQVEQRRIEHIHAHYATHAAMAAYVAHRLTGVPYSFTVHAHDLYCHRAMLQCKLQAARCVITISQFNARLLAAYQPPGQAPTPIHVVRCGVESAGGAPGPRVAAEKEAPLRLLAVGSLQRYKGHRHLIAACARLRGRLPFILRIAGGGGLRRRLERQIRQCGLEVEGAPGGVQLLGAVTEDEVAELLRWADVLVMPSVVDPRSGQMEGIPVALMEAMAAGLAVVASRISGIPELVRDGANGLLVEPGDEAGLAGAIERCQDRALRRRLGAAAQVAVAAEFDLATNVSKLAAVLGGQRAEFRRAEA